MLQMGALGHRFRPHSDQYDQYDSPALFRSRHCYAKVMAITYGVYDGYSDNIMFEKSQLARGFNMLENSSFEQGSTQWTNSYSSAAIVYRQYVYDPYGNIISVKDSSGNSINLSTDSFNNAYLLPLLSAKSPSAIPETPV